MGRRLYRSEEDKILAGVCSGLAKAAQVDPLIIRMAFVALAISDFYIGVIFYGVAALVMPSGSDRESGEVEVVHHPEAEDPRSSRRTLGKILIGLGAGLLLYRLLPRIPLWNQYLPVVRLSLWPLALIILGVLVLFRQRP